MLDTWIVSIIGFMLPPSMRKQQKQEDHSQLLIFLHWSRTCDHREEVPSLYQQRETSDLWRLGIQRRIWINRTDRIPLVYYHHILHAFSKIIHLFIKPSTKIYKLSCFFGSFISESSHVSKSWYDINVHAYLLLLYFFKGDSTMSQKILKENMFSSAALSSTSCPPSN